MAAKYWYKVANGSDNWSVAANWYLGSGGTGGTTTVPTSADDVYLDSASGSGTITLASASTCNSFNATGFTGTLAGASGLNITNQTTMGASSLTPLFAFGSGMTLTYTGIITFGGTTGLGGWIYFNGKTHLGGATFNNAVINATFTLQDNFTISAVSGTGSTLNITNGTVLANFNVSCNDFTYGTGIKSFICTDLFLTGTGTLVSGPNAATTTNIIDNIIVNNSSVTTKSITMGVSFGSINIELGGSGSGGFTLSPATTYKPNVNITNTGGATLTISTGAITNLTFVSGTNVKWSNTASQTLTFWGNLTFLSTQPNPTLTPALLFNQNATSNITMAGKVLVTGAITINNPSHYVNFLDIFNCPLINVTINDSSVVYFKANFTCAALSNGLTSLLVVEKNLTCTTLTTSGNSFVETGVSGSNYYPSLVNIAGAFSMTGAGSSLICNAGTFNCTSISVGINCTLQVQRQNVSYPVTVNCSSVSLVSGGTLFINNSTFNCSGTFSTVNGLFSILNESFVYFTTFTMSGVSSQFSLSTSSQKSPILYLTGTGTAFSMATTVISVDCAVNSRIEFTDTSASTITFGGGGWTYYEVVFNRGASTGINIISGNNSFTNFRDLGTVAHTISITSGTTQTFGNFDVRGTPGNIISLIRSSTTAVLLAKSPRGFVICDYLNITNVPVNNVNTWYAGPNSTVTTSANWIVGGRVRRQSALGVG